MSALDTEQQARLLTLYPILAALEPVTRTRLLEAVQIMRLPAGTVLFDERQACQGFPLILEGAVRVVKASASGRELPLYRVTPGEDRKSTRLNSSTV
jgi:CRP/FNR family transcriptional regulator